MRNKESYLHIKKTMYYNLEVIKIYSVGNKTKKWKRLAQHRVIGARGSEEVFEKQIYFTPGFLTHSFYY